MARQDEAQASAYISISGLRIHANHGVDPQETIVGNTFEVDLKFEFDCEFAMRTDRVDRTINYADVVELIKEEMAHPSKLLENAVYHIYTALIRRYPQITTGEITVAKLAPPIEAELDRVAFTFQWSTE